ncbi:MAG: secretin N-terminal domain-containing protein [Aestuariibacter sp.]
MRRLNVCITITAMLLAGCTSTPDKDKSAETRKYVLSQSYLSEEPKKIIVSEETSEETEESSRKSFERLVPLKAKSKETISRVTASSVFESNEQVRISADDMPLVELVHYAFGEVLGTNYIIDSALKKDKTRITLNVNEPVTKVQLFEMLADLLARYQVTIDFNESTFFLQKAELSKAKAVIGIGREISSVPNTSGKILQVIPVKYGIKITLERTIRDLIDGNISIDFEQSAIFVMGDRANVLRAIELLNILDVPANKGKNIGLLALTYMPPEKFLMEIKTLLRNEGIAVGVGEEINNNVLLVPLNHIGSIAVFATDEELMDRVRYWASVLDKPTQGENEQYFVYNPSYARASDLGESIGQLLTLGRPTGNNQKATGSDAERLRTDSTSAPTTINSEDISFVVDERTNSLIFNTKGSHYQNLLPLLQKLDVLPKQILLEVMIAEVTLTDDFKYGVEFALRNSSRFTAATQGAFGVGDIGGLGFSFIDGGTQAAANFFKENRFVNVISNPSMLVRDGISASITVGTQIPVETASVSQDGGNVTTSVEYRNTGVSVNVTPTVNAQGVVIMTIAQNISNTVDASASTTRPAIFNRSLDTEVVVSSGQTVILGGLISEDNSSGETKVPILGDLPGIGNLFRSNTRNKTKTELVMLVTPKVLETNDEWNKVLGDFQNGLESLRIVK